MLAGGLGAVVAADAVAADVDVIKIRGQPADGRVAVVAVVATRDMRRVLADRRYAVMAGSAGAHDLRVIDRCRRLESRSVMAIFADVARLNVCRTLAGCGRAVMAADAVTGDAAVIERSGQPGCRGVTVVALVP